MDYTQLNNAQLITEIEKRGIVRGNKYLSKNDLMKLLQEDDARKNGTPMPPSPPPPMPPINLSSSSSNQQSGAHSEMHDMLNSPAFKHFLSNPEQIRQMILKDPDCPAGMRELAADADTFRAFVEQIPAHTGVSTSSFLSSTSSSSSSRSSSSTSSVTTGLQIALFSHQGSWMCPRCDRTLNAITCSDCKVDKDLLGMAYTSPCIGRLETLFIDIIDQQKGQESLYSDATDVEPFKRRLDEIINSEDMNRLIRANWHIKEKLQMLILLVLSEDTSRMTVPLCDRGDEDFYITIVKRLNERHRQKFGSPCELLSSLAKVSNGGSSSTSTLSGSPLFATASWICPLCATSNTGDKKDCVLCDLALKVPMLFSQNAQKEMVQRFVSLSKNGLDITISTISAAEKIARRTTLKSEVLAFIESEVVCNLEERGFSAKRHLNSFFVRLVKGENNFPWKITRHLDKNSVGCYAICINALIAEVSSQSSAYANKIVVSKPNHYGLEFTSAVFGNIPNARFRRTDSANALIKSAGIAFEHICRGIAYTMSQVGWNQFNSVYDQLEGSGGFMIRAPIELMMVGIRDLDTLVADLRAGDLGTRCLVEALLHRVNQLEKEAWAESEDLIYLNLETDSIAGNATCSTNTTTTSSSSSSSSSISSSSCAVGAQMLTSQPPKHAVIQYDEDDDDDDGPPELEEIMPTVHGGGSSNNNSNSNSSSSNSNIDDDDDGPPALEELSSSQFTSSIEGGGTGGVTETTNSSGGASSSHSSSTFSVEKIAKADKAIAFIMKSFVSNNQGRAALEFLRAILKKIIDFPGDEKFLSINPESEGFKKKSVLGSIDILDCADFKRELETKRLKFQGNMQSLTAVYMKLDNALNKPLEYVKPK